MAGPSEPSSQLECLEGSLLLVGRQQLPAITWLLLLHLWLRPRGLAGSQSLARLPCVRTTRSASGRRASHHREDRSPVSARSTTACCWPVSLSDMYSCDRGHPVESQSMNRSLEIDKESLSVCPRGRNGDCSFTRSPPPSHGHCNEHSSGSRSAQVDWSTPLTVNRL